MRVSEKDPLSGLIGWLIIIAVTSIGLEEFVYLPAGPVTLKVSVVLTLGIAAIILSTGRVVSLLRALSPLLAIWISLVVFSSVLSVIFKVEVRAVNDDVVDQGSRVLTKTLGLLCLVLFGLLLRAYCRWETICRAMYGLTAVMVLKGLAIDLMVALGYREMLASLPNGLARYSFAIGGMTPNQTGAIWLVLLTFWSCCVFYFPRPGVFKTALLCICIYYGLQTWSRSFAGGCVLLLFVILIDRRRLRMALGLFLVTWLGYYLYTVIAPDHLLSESTYDRLYRWENALSNFSDRPLLGSGFGSVITTHNTWLQLLAETGMLGTLSMAILIVAGIASSLQRRWLLAYLAVSAPYWIFLSFDIGILQWQTWLLFGMCPTLVRTMASQNQGKGDASRSSQSNKSVRVDGIWSLS